MSECRRSQMRCDSGGYRWWRRRLQSRRIKLCRRDEHRKTGVQGVLFVAEASASLKPGRVRPFNIEVRADKKKRQWRGNEDLMTRCGVLLAVMMMLPQGRWCDQETGDTWTWCSQGYQPCVLADGCTQLSLCIQHCPHHTVENALHWYTPQIVPYAV